MRQYTARLRTLAQRRPSPLPITLAALVMVLGVRLAELAPSPLAQPSSLGAMQTAMAQLDPAAGPRHEATPLGAHEDLAAAQDLAMSAWLEDLLAPAAGPEGLPEPLSPTAGDAALAAEPFLAERRALARQREALNVRQLAIEVAEQRLRALLDELTGLKSEVEMRLDELEAGDEARLGRLVEIYEKMRPKDAARIFDELDFAILVPLALEMSARKLAPIVAEMTPETARRLTADVARQRAEASLTAELERVAP